MEMNMELIIEDESITLSEFKDPRWCVLFKLEQNGFIKFKNKKIIPVERSPKDTDFKILKPFFKLRSENKHRTIFKHI